MYECSTQYLPDSARDFVRNFDRLFPRTNGTTYRGDRHDAADIDDDDFLGDMAKTLRNGGGSGPRGLSGRARRERIERRKAKEAGLVGAVGGGGVGNVGGKVSGGKTSTGRKAVSR